MKAQCMCACVWKKRGGGGGKAHPQIVGNLMDNEVFNRLQSYDLKLTAPFAAHPFFNNRDVAVDSALCGFVLFLCLLHIKRVERDMIFVLSLTAGMIWIVYLILECVCVGGCSMFFNNSKLNVMESWVILLSHSIVFPFFNFLIHFLC